MQVKKVVLSKNIVELPENLFSFSSVEEVVCTNHLKKIGDYAFVSSCLKKINLPEGLTTIGNGAFADCMGLKRITIPKTVKSIGDYVFVQEVGKITIKFLGNQPPKMGCFETKVVGEGMTGYTIYVPKSSKKSYQSAINKRNKQVGLKIRTY